MLGIAIIILVWEFVYGQPLDEQKLEQQFEDHFEKAISNITGMAWENSGLTDPKYQVFGE